MLVHFVDYVDTKLNKILNLCRFSLKIIYIYIQENLKNMINLLMIDLI